MAPSKERDAGNGRSLAKSRNAAWRHFSRNPSGRACFFAPRRYPLFVWNDQTSLLMPCCAKKQVHRVFPGKAALIFRKKYSESRKP
jgi:hypothetical protein